jgi:hypothetical protein
MLLKAILTCSLTGFSLGISAQPTSIAAMGGQCQENSQLTRVTAEQVVSKEYKYQLYRCNSALITELVNGRVLIHFSQSDSSDGVVVGYAGYYVGTVDPKNRYVEVDGMYFTGQNFDEQRQNAIGHCEIVYKGGKVTSLGCLSGTKLETGDRIVSSAIFRPSHYSIKRFK